MSDIEKFREVARLMSELDARVQYFTISVGDGDRDTVHLEHVPTGSPGEREWRPDRDAAAMPRAIDVEKLRELARLLTEVDAVTWRGTVWMGGYDLEDPDAVYLKHEPIGFRWRGLVYEWRVSRDA